MPLLIQNSLYPVRNYGCIMIRKPSGVGEKISQLSVEYSVYLASKAEILQEAFYSYKHLCLYLLIDLKGLIDEASLGLQFGWQLAVSLGPRRFQGK